MTNYQKHLTAQLIDAINLLYDALLNHHYENELSAILRKDLDVSSIDMRICLTNMETILANKMED